MVTRWRSFAFGALLGLSAPACSSPRCEPEEACDIRKQSCQRAALRWAKCLRRTEADVDVKVVTVDEGVLRDQWLAEEQGGTGADPDPDAMTFGLSMLDLARVLPLEQSISQRIDWLGAFYDPETKQVTVVDHGQALDSPGAIALLVHELVHALQDASGAFAMESAPQFDAWLARRAITEGEATVLEDEAITDGLGFDFHELDYEHVLDQFLDSSLSNLVYSSRSVFEDLSLFFPYAHGASYLWEKPGYTRNVREAYAKTPVSTYAVMTRDPARFAERFNDLGPSAVPVLEGYEAPRHLHLGRFTYLVWVERLYQTLRGGNIEALRASRDHFEADTLAVFTSAERTTVSWRVRFDDEPSAQALEQGFHDYVVQAEPVYSSVGRAGRDVWIVMTNDTSLQLEQLAPFTWAEASGPDAGFGVQDPASRRVYCLRSERR